MNHLSTWASVCVLVALCACPTQASIVIETVPVGDPDNVPDTRYATSGYGGVGYEYTIGKYEVTAGEYCAFLNAVAKIDIHGLYNTRMSDPAPGPGPDPPFGYGCNIQRSGTSGSYAYSVAPDWANRPVNYVSWGDAARFANWLHNGQPTGEQDATTTEDGSYSLNGATSGTALIAIMREPDATWVIPSEDEWYKAAYYKGGGPSAGYWDYPTSANSTPSNVVTDPDPGNNANYIEYHGSDDVTWSIGSPYYRNEGGEFENSSSPYGTFDQGGDVWEWNEAVIGASRSLRGGSFSSVQLNLHAAGRSHTNPSGDYYSFGFRVALVPEPATLVTLALATVGVLRRRR